MKKFILPIAIASLLIACGGSSSGEKKEDDKKEDKKEASADISNDPDYKKGLALVAGSDCFTCHKVDEQFTGPSYKDVAIKYAGMPDTIITHLAGKIINGGTGVWGAIYMTEHKTISQEDAEAMVKYIMKLK